MRAYLESSKIFTAFCDETRLKVLSLLRSGEKCANVLLKQVSIGQSTLSHHMKILVESGIVTARKVGKWTYYSICESGRQRAAEMLKRLTTLTEISIPASGAPKQKYIIKEDTTMTSFSIMIDTNCDLPPEYLKQHSITSLPITYDLDGEPHDDGYWEKIAGKDFYDALRNGSVAKTAQINPETFTEIFTEYAKNNRALIFLILSSGLSATYQSAQIALQEVRETYPDCSIYPIDSISASVGVGLLVTLLVKKREEGLSAEEAAAWLEEKKHSCLGLFTVDDLMYLHRGGRLSKFSAIAGSVLNVKPVLNLAPDGTLALKGKTRGRKPSMELLTEQFKRSIDPGAELDTVLIAHTDCESDAETFAGLVRKAVNVKHIIIMLMGPVIGAHLGPGALVLLYEASMTRETYEKTFYTKK